MIMIQINDSGLIANIVQSPNSKISNVTGKSYYDILQTELKTIATFDEMYKTALEKYFGQTGQTFYHVMDASSIRRDVWTHNDFPYEKFLTDNVDETILNWNPTRSNPSQLNPEVQNKLNATLGKHSIIVPPELDERMKTDEKLRQKVISNINKVYRFHTQQPKFHLPGTKVYGTKIYGSVTILNSDGEVENCVVTSGGTFIGPDEHTLRQIEEEQKRKLKRKEFNDMIIAEAQIQHHNMIEQLNLL